MQPKDPSDKPVSRISRRSFLRAVGGGAAATVLGGAASVVVASEHDEIAWDQETDVVVVGTGGAAGAAAAGAIENGASVIVLEKGGYGGTTAKSGGTSWVPNNARMRERGLDDPKDDAMRYMARLAFPAWYRPDDAMLGLPEHNYVLLEAFYDHGARAFEGLEAAGALRTVTSMSWTGEPTPDYYAHVEENKAPRGRSINPGKEDGSSGFGADMVRQMREYLMSKDVPILLGHHVTTVITDEDGAVLGVEAVDRSNAAVRVRARKGVIFGSGGFTHNREMALNYLRGPIYGGCAVPTNQGDLVTISEEMGVKLGNMNEAWLQEEILEQVLEFSSVPSGVWFLTGDSMVTVNRHGHRVYDEKHVYNERTRVHYSWDPQSNDYPNLLLYFLYDQRTADLYPGAGGPIPPADAGATYVIRGEDWADLERNVNARLAELAPQIGQHRLADDFLDNLSGTVERFNGFAETGEDLDFQRGTLPISAHFHGPRKDGNDKPNAYMYPLSDTGPYYCIVLAPGTLDTKGGPVTTPHGQAVDARGVPIRGMYAVGNAMASPSGKAYWGAGGTLGPALTFGWLAGEHAAGQDPT
jgi:succinate dehydrogenase/fumarate reductase flavoprotein subunit